MEDLEVKINLPLPLDRPYICSQSVLISGIFSFFGGITNENSLIKHDNYNKGKICSFSITKPEQLYESSIETPCANIIASSTVYCEEIATSFTFGGLSFSYNESTRSIEKTPISSIYAIRWISGALNESQANTDILSSAFFSNSSRKLIPDNLFNPADDIFNIEDGFSGMINLQKSNRMFSPELSNKKPSPRYFHSACWDQKNQLMWIFGGISSIQEKRQYLNDIWVWSLYTGMWYKINTKNPPKPRAGSSMTFINGKIYLFGGYSPNYTKAIFKNPKYHYQELSDDDQEVEIIDDDINNLKSQEEYYFYYLDISSVRIDPKNICDQEFNKFSELSWKPIENIPFELKKKLFGAVILPYCPTPFHSFIIFSGGCLSNKYDSIMKLTDTNEIIPDLDPMTIIFFDTQTSEFRIQNVNIESIPEISYHAATVSKDGILYIAGGIFTSNRSNSKYNFHNCVRSIDLSHLFSFTMTSEPSIDQSILYSINVLPNASDPPLLDKSDYQDFVQVVKNEIESVSSQIRTQKLYKVFLSHQQFHTPLSDFIVTSNGLYASLSVLEKRIGRPFLPSTRIPHYLLHDLFLFAYTDLIDPSQRFKAGCDQYDIYSFSAFIDFCRARGLYRLIALEFGAHVSAMSPCDFLSLCVSTCNGSMGAPLFSDSHLVFLRTLFARVIPKHHQHIDFKSVGKMHPKLSKFILSEIYNRCDKKASIASGKPATIDALFATKKAKFFVPESKVQFELACFMPDGEVETADGAVGSDSSSLELDANQLAKSKLSVVKAVKTFCFKPLFDIGDVDDIYDAFRLVGESLTYIDGYLLEKILNDSKELFLNFASRNTEFKQKLIFLVRNIEYQEVLEFALKMIGINGLTVVIGRDQKKFVYDSKLGTPLPADTITVDVSKDCIMALFILMYNYVSIQSNLNEKMVIPNFLPKYINLRQLADELLTVCATSCLVSPCPLRQAIGDFIIDQLFQNGDVTEEKFLERFPRLFDANLHDEVVKRKFSKSEDVKASLSSPKRKSPKSSPKSVALSQQEAASRIDFRHLEKIVGEQPKFIDKLSEEQLRWIIEKAKTSKSKAEVIAKDDDENESDEDDFPFSK